MKRILIFLTVALSILLVSCQGNPSSDNNTGEGDGSPGVREENKILFSNMSGGDSAEEVKSILKAHLNSGNVDRFMEGVAAYNEAIEKTGLTADFEKKPQPEYDLEKTGELWAAKKGGFIGTNCRINTFMLLKDDIEIKEGESDDSLLFLDRDAIRAEHLFSGEETERFNRLFSRVKTENTKDIRVHGEKMREHFSDIGFNEGAKMLSVVLHDNLDGDYLFIGHAGVLAENKGKYLFVEKLSFEEPFQAVKFDRKEDCFRYLFSKYGHYHDETTAKPFIMENGEPVEPELYEGKK